MLKRFLTVLLAATLLFACLPAGAACGEELAEWTVMLYLCGTDLESENMAATINLAEILDTDVNDQVHFIIETGGTRTWHTAEVFDGYEIKSDRLQRYSVEKDIMRLVDEQPLANMASADTLTDFIQWTAENYPAKKNMLILWDHGGGSFSGILVDELHGDANMQVEDLSRALANAQVPLEALATDACLMATLEVAQAVQPYSHYLIASEEVVPGWGCAYSEWMQYLYDHPTCNGAELGQVYCDAIMNKYAAVSQSQQATLTYSTIDLSKLDAVSAAFDAMFTEIGALLSDPTAFSRFTYDTQHTQTFSGSAQYDLMDMAIRAGKGALSAETANAVVEAVQAAVVYNVHGSAQTYANGLSFYYAPQSRYVYLDHFARTCKSAPYLAFLDAASMAWTAPPWVYEQVERLPEIRRVDYSVEATASIGDDGLPTLTVTNAPLAVAFATVQLYEYREDDKEYRVLGDDVNVTGDFERGVFHYAFEGLWPSIQGHLCQMNILNELDEYTLYRIPFTTENTLEEFIKNDKSMEFRAGFVYDHAGEIASDEPLTGEYQLYGVWNNTNSASDMPSRDVWDIADFDGEELMLLRETANVYTGQVESCLISKAFAFKSGKPAFEKIALPTGQYAMVFMVKDVFGKTLRSAPITIEYNAKKGSVVYSMME